MVSDESLNPLYLSKFSFKLAFMTVNTQQMMENSKLIMRKECVLNP